MDAFIENLTPTGLMIATIVPRIVALLIFALLLQRLANRLVPSMVHAFPRPNQEGSTLDQEDILRRRETMSDALVRGVDILILVVVIFMVMSELGFDLTPLLASAGIVGLVIGFGSQVIVKDLFSGVAILVENQYSKGDVVQIAGITGVVEEINLRRTIVRDGDGVVHSVPNGEIRVASNKTRGWAHMDVEVTIPYDADLDKAQALLNKVGMELAADESFAPLITEAPKVMQIAAFGPLGVLLKVGATTRPLKQGDVASELRRRIKTAFDAEGIGMPYSRQVIIQEKRDTPPPPANVL